MPQAGGQYVYLREAFGPLWGFLYGWTLFLVIQTGTVAAVAVAFAKFTGVFFPAVSADSWMLPFLNTQQLARDRYPGFPYVGQYPWAEDRVRVQNVFTFAKDGGLAGFDRLRPPNRTQ